LIGLIFTVPDRHAHPYLWWEPKGKIPGLAVFSRWRRPILVFLCS